jgi:hypothetical protein
MLLVHMFFSRFSTPTLSHARAIAEALPSAHPALLQSDLQLLLNVLHADPSCRVLLSSLKAREQHHLAGRIAALAGATPAAGALPHDGLATPSQRAALGLLLIETLLKDPRCSSLELGNRLTDLGRLYQPRGLTDTSDAQALKNFVRAFATPLLDHLAYEQDADDLIRATLLRYKQRSEWFRRDRLMDLATAKDQRKRSPSIERRGVKRSNQVERRLLTDLYQYLFDTGMDFTLESYTPSRSARPDIVSAVLPNGRRLVLEVKVFDDSRKPSHLAQGIHQAKSYADDWAEPSAYCLIYNIAPGVTLDVIGAQRHGEFHTITLAGKDIHLLILNLNPAPLTTPVPSGAQLPKDAPAKTRTVLLNTTTLHP